MSSNPEVQVTAIRSLDNKRNASPAFGLAEATFSDGRTQKIDWEIGHDGRTRVCGPANISAAHLDAFQRYMDKDLKN